MEYFCSLTHVNLFYCNVICICLSGLTWYVWFKNDMCYIIVHELNHLKELCNFNSNYNNLAYDRIVSFLFFLQVYIYQVYAPFSYKLVITVSTS